jgi:hypothetical protein
VETNVEVPRDRPSSHEGFRATFRQIQRNVPGVKEGALYSGGQNYHIAEDVWTFRLASACRIQRGGAYEHLSRNPRPIYRRIGDDDEILPLQGADVVAWASRRKHSGDGLTEEFAPLKQLFEERFTADGLRVRPHLHYSVNDDTGRLTTEAVNTELPKLLEELSQLIDDTAEVH